MGSWNGTCGISQLSIPAGYKVKTILLVQSGYTGMIEGSGSCYPSTYFSPWFLPVDAEYNDYGSIENIKMDWNAKFMLETFQKWNKTNHVKILDEDAEINSPEISEFKTLEDVFKCVERGALVVKKTTPDWNNETKIWEPSNRYLKVSIFMVLVPVWKALIKEYDRFHSDPQNKWCGNYVEEQHEMFVNDLKKIKEKRAKKELLDTDKALEDIYIEKNLKSSCDEGIDFTHYESLIFTLPEEELNIFLSEIKNIRKISMVMIYLRKLWFPQSGQGSQSEELSFNKALISGMNKHIEKREAKIKKDTEECECCS